MVRGKAVFDNIGIERDVRLAPPPPLSRCAPQLIIHEVLESDNQEGSQFSLFTGGGIEPAFFEQTTEELLCQILRVVMRVPTTPDINIEWLPIGAANGFECR